MSYPYGFADPSMYGMGGAPRRTKRFNEYFRCYPVVMMQGPSRPEAEHGGKIFLPASALDKLTRLHIAYPMLFELIHGGVEENGQLVNKKSHAGVLEFTAEEGRVYMPQWLMEAIKVEAGDMIQVLSTDLPSGTFIKLQPQSPDFLDISDPKAVLEHAFRNFSCLTVGDIFTFQYNDHVYRVAVLEAKPETDKKAICTLETDLSVDFAPPIGYVEPQRTSGTSTPRSGRGVAPGGLMHAGQGSMAQSINYAAIAPGATSAAAGAKAVAAHFASGGHKLGKKGSAAATPITNPSTPVAGTSTNPRPLRRVNLNGPQPLRLPPNTLFFGYEIKPLKNKEEADKVDPERHFQGGGQSLRGKKN